MDSIRVDSRSFAILFRALIPGLHRRKLPQNNRKGPAAHTSSGQGRQSDLGADDGSCDVGHLASPRVHVPSAKVGRSRRDSTGGNAVYDGYSSSLPEGRRSV